MLYTRKGDSGTTKFFHSEKGERVSKSSPVFEALGTVDELNCHLGFCKALAKDTKDRLLMQNSKESYEDIIEKIQQCLFSLQAELGGATFYIKDAHVKYLEEIIAEVELFLPPITSFIVPGGGKTGAYLDVSRTVARRAERGIVRLKEENIKEINEQSLIFINRLSSALYALARFANYQEGYTEDKPSYQ
jgi:cob(I)alamin adenosyltransferase